MDNTSEARRKKIMRRKRAMLKRTHRRINVTFIIVFVLLLVLGVRIFMINYTHGEDIPRRCLIIRHIHQLQFLICVVILLQVTEQFWHIVRRCII